MEFRTPTTGMKQEPELDHYLIPRPLYHYQQEGAESLNAGLVTSLTTLATWLERKHQPHQLLLMLSVGMQL